MRAARVIAQRLADAEILDKKGVRLNYGNLVNSVANYVIVYPPFPSPKRKLYRNPYITVNDLTKESEIWPKEEKQEK